MNINNLSLYIHIPFCESKCSYCDFISMPIKTAQEIEQYIDCLASEMSLLSAWIGNAELDTIYLGGGTPSLLSLNNLQKLFSNIENNFLLSKDYEFTVEVNPGSIDEEKLNLMMNNGVNRISLGVQSLDDSELLKLGRIHSVNDVLTTVDVIQGASLTNWSIDLMYGIPLQTNSSWLYTLQQAVTLEPKHISAYELSVERGTKFFENQEIVKLLPTEAELEDMVDDTKQILKEAGFRHYEISNYAKQGFQSRHNGKYWKNMNYIGLGLAAWSCLTNIRWQNPINIIDYTKTCQRSTFLPFVNYAKQIDCEQLSLQTQIKEYIMLTLRTSHGLVVSEIDQRFFLDFESEYKLLLHELTKQKLLIKTNFGYRLSERGMAIAHTIIEKFF